MRVELYGEEWAELRDAETLTRGERTRLLQAARDAEAEEDPERPVGKASNAIFAALVDKWSLSLDLPSTRPEVVDDILAVDFVALDEACSQVMRKLMPAVNFAVSQEPESPTKPSSD